jgi:5'-3' exonuclease
VVRRYGVRPSQMPDFQALVGDSSDGYPGLRGWGPKSAAPVLQRWVRIEDIPDDSARWEVEVRGAARLAATLAGERDLAYLFRDLATLRRDAPVSSGVDALEWRGPGPPFEEFCRRVEATNLVERAARLAPS